jgi:hypothetical protein
MQKFDAEKWVFADYFDPAHVPLSVEDNRMVRAAHAYLASARIGDHPFFLSARGNPAALAVWSSQECVITNHFSQTLFALIAMVGNVHVRSILLPVVAGEHSPIKNGLAVGSHPHLLAKLLEDIGIKSGNVKPLPFTVHFAEALTNSLQSTIFGLGFLGIGNEAMLIPEYTAVEGLFSLLYSRDLYRPFLRANIEEDRTHASIMESVAIALCRGSYDEYLFLRGAEAGVDARIRYYDDLLAYLEI